MIYYPIWKGLEYDSVEECTVRTDSRNSISSNIRGNYNGQSYFLDYKIETDSHWSVSSVKIAGTIDGIRKNYSALKDGLGNWKSESLPVADYSDCVDIDISLTPFTNTLPINRLCLKIGEQAEIKVLYFDILESKAHPVYQKYSRLSLYEYLFQTVPNDFEAKITVDEAGLVVEYPGLFTRIDHHAKE